ncbi:MAG: hypothetical protein ACE5JG_12180, partial [Planctomycetota bacterium]
ATTTFSTLYTRTLDMSHLSTSDSTALTLAKLGVNSAYRSWADYADWPELVKYPRQSLRTAARLDVDNDTANLTKGSTTVTDANATFITDGVAVDDLVKDAAEDELYQVASVDSETQLTLRSAYNYDSKTTGNLDIWRWQYTLPSDFGRPVDMMQYQQTPGIVHDMGLNFMDESIFTLRGGRGSQEGKPDTYTLVGKNSSDVWIAQVYPLPDDVYQLPINYIVQVTDLSADADTPLIREDRVWSVLLPGALALLWGFQGDQRAELKRREFEAELLQAAAADGLAQSRYQIRPAWGDFTGRIKRRPQGGRYHLGDAFGRGIIP